MGNQGLLEPPSQPFDWYVDGIALVYHESRNVRHLIKAGAISAEGWAKLVTLAHSKYDAWSQLQPIRIAARQAGSVWTAARLFSERFGRTIPELVALSGHRAWRGSRCGGNAWVAIGEQVGALGRSLESAELSAAESAMQALQAMNHNTGTIAAKRAELDRYLEQKHAKEELMRAKRILPIVVLAVVSACAMPASQGRLVDLTDGSTIVLSMTFSKWGGHMVGEHPLSGERFEGDYTATLEGANARVGNTNVSARASVARGAGTLAGNRGTVLDCELNINPGNYITGTAPTGNGLCTDQRGGRFRLQF